MAWQHGNLEKLAIVGCSVPISIPFGIQAVFVPLSSDAVAKPRSQQFGAKRWWLKDPPPPQDDSVAVFVMFEAEFFSHTGKSFPKAKGQNFRGGKNRSRVKSVPRC